MDGLAGLAALRELGCTYQVWGCAATGWWGGRTQRRRVAAAKRGIGCKIP